MSKYLLVLSLFFSSHIESQVLHEVDSIVVSAMDSLRITGLSLGMVKDGEIIYAKGYGETSVGSSYSITANSYFLTASISKLFTASAIMQLKEQGKIDLNEKLAKYLPDFKMKDERYKDITLFHLLTHSSGLKWDHSLKDSPDDSNALRLFSESFTKEKLKFAPGEHFDGTTYSNAGYDLLGFVIEKVSGLTFDEYIKRNILDPLRMTHSTYVHDTIPKELKAIPQVLSGKSKEIRKFNLYGIIKDENPVLKYPQNPIVDYPCYGLNKEHDPSENFISSAHDLNKWMIQLLHIYNDSTGKDSGVLSHKTLREMWSLQKAIENKKTSIGLGWWRYPDEDFGKYVHHTGRHPGFCSNLMIFPESNFGIVILCNAKHADQYVWNHLPLELMKILRSENEE